MSLSLLHGILFGVLLGVLICSSHYAGYRGGVREQMQDRERGEMPNANPTLP
jgi:hypothetical protein